MRSCCRLGPIRPIAASSGRNPRRNPSWDEPERQAAERHSPNVAVDATAQRHVRTYKYISKYLVLFIQLFFLFFFSFTYLRGGTVGCALQRHQDAISRHVSSSTRLDSSSNPILG